MPKMYLRILFCYKEGAGFLKLPALLMKWSRVSCDINDWPVPELEFLNFIGKMHFMAHEPRKGPL